MSKYSFPALVLVLAALSPCGSAATIGTVGSSVSTVPAGLATSVTFTATITDSSLIPGSVNLLSVDSAGRTTVVGIMHDDGLNGDATAGDHIYSFQFTVFQQTTGTINYRVSAAFQGSLVRPQSGLIPLTITGVSTAITITSPADAAYLNISPTPVTGTVGDPSATVKINGIAAQVSGTSFSASVPLQEGINTLTAVAQNSNNSVSTASETVTLDTTPPHVTIDTPSNNAVTTASSVNVSGIVNDIVVGTVNNQQATVTVNGISAQVTNRTYSAVNVPLVMGSNTIQATGRDRAGNFATVNVTVVRQAATQPNLSIVSGNNLTGSIKTLLSAPLVVALLNGTGQPIPNTPVVFKVTGGDGTVSATATPGLSSVAVNTNAQGQAQVYLTLGSRAGAGNNMVTASSAGVATTAVFTESANSTAVSAIVVDSGNDQSGVVGQALPLAFIAIVTDAGHNRLGNVPVTFTVTQGGGSFGGQGAITTTSDSDGRVQAVLTLSATAGPNAVTANFGGNTGLPATFTATGLVPGPAANTIISGVVLDNSNNPIPGVTMRLYQANSGANNNVPQQVGTPVQTNPQGFFQISPAPVGVFKLMADGTTATGPGAYPTLEYDIVTVAGQNNTVGSPIYLPQISAAALLCVTATTGGTLTVPQAPGFALTIAPGSATFPGGTRSGCVSVTPVNSDKIPMVPGFGQQPRFIVTIQPVGTTFNPPAAITIPNVDGLAPRAVTEMYSYDHDLATFTAIGTGTVSVDGSVIASDPGVGVLKAGWHCGGDPNSSGSAASLGLSVSPSAVSLAPNQSATLTANGTPPLDGSYSWELVSAQAGDDTSAAVLTSAPSCPGLSSCAGVIKGVHGGQLTLRVHFICNTTGVTVTQDVRVMVLGAQVDVNGTTVTSDDITSINPVQTIPIKITLMGGAGAVTLAVTPASRGTLDQTSLTLANGGMGTVTFTPASQSAAVNDTMITASYMGNQIGVGMLTVVRITYPAHITTANNPTGVPDRIPPRVNTPATITLVPDLTGSGQNVQFVPMNNNATNGDFTLGGAAMVTLTTTTAVNLSGTAQTAPTAGLGGGNVGNLNIVAMVRGQANALSPGFTVAALPSGMTESSGGAITLCGTPPTIPCYGLSANVVVNSDSGVVGDLDQVDFSEQVAVDTETGNLVGLGGGMNSTYLSVTGGPYADSHTTGIHPWTDAPGTQVLDQTHTFRDRRTGVNDIPIPQSGYHINRNVFASPPPAMGFSLTTSKGGAATSANGFASTAGAPAAAFSVTQP